MYQALPPDIWLVTGAPGAARTAVARALAQRLERAAHIEGDRLAEGIVTGRVLPGEEPAEESERQVELCIRNQCLLARSYAEAGFTPVIDYVIPTEHHLDAYRNYLMGGRIRLIVLAPDAETPLELPDCGLWLDTRDLDAEAAAEAILDRRDEALMR